MTINNNAAITSWTRKAWDVLVSEGVEPATLRLIMDGHVVTVQKWDDVSCSMCCGNGCEACGDTGVNIERGSMSVYVTSQGGSVMNTSPRSREALDQFLESVFGGEAGVKPQVEQECPACGFTAPRAEFHNGGFECPWCGNN